GLIIGCGLAQFKSSKGKKCNEANRLFKILVSESAFNLVWKLRNDRVVHGRVPTETEIHNRWVNSINTRLRLDRLLTDTTRYGNRAMNIKTVLRTWDGVLMDNKNLP
ncbi:hypothetical protein B0H13DRAFT_1568251, partial [Mycena leptocephala]